MKLVWIYLVLFMQACGATTELELELKKMAQGGAAAPDRSFFELVGRQMNAQAPESATTAIIGEACRLLQDRRTDVEGRAIYVLLAAQIMPNAYRGAQMEACLDSLVRLGSDTSNPNRTGSLSVMSYIRPVPERVFLFFRQQLIETRNNVDDLTVIYAVLLERRDEALTTAVIEHAKTLPSELYATSNVMRILGILRQHDAAGLAFIRQSLDSADEESRHGAIVAINRMVPKEKASFADRMRTIAINPAESARNRSEALEALK